MARTIKPLLANQASGQVGKAVIHSTWKGRSYAKKYSQPTTSLLARVQGARAVLTFLSQRWPALSASDKLTWQSEASARQISPFDLYCGLNLRRFAADSGLTNIHDPLELVTGPTATPGTWKIFGRIIEVGCTTGPVCNTAGAYLHRSTVPGFTPGPDNCVQAFLPKRFTTVKVNDRPGQPGTYYYRTRSSGTDGKLYTNPYQLTAILT